MLVIQARAVANFPSKLPPPRHARHRAFVLLSRIQLPARACTLVLKAVDGAGARPCQRCTLCAMPMRAYMRSGGHTNPQHTEAHTLQRTCAPLRTWAHVHSNTGTHTAHQTHLCPRTHACALCAAKRCALKLRNRHRLLTQHILLHPHARTYLLRLMPCLHGPCCRLRLHLLQLPQQPLLPRLRLRHAAAQHMANLSSAHPQKDSRRAANCHAAKSHLRYQHPTYSQPPNTGRCSTPGSKAEAAPGRRAKAVHIPRKHIPARPRWQRLGA